MSTTIDAPPASARVPFPSLRIRAGGFEPRGAFAEAQAAYLEPDPAAVRTLAEQLERTQIGVVAHFYMDAELQGTLAAIGGARVHVADSLQMAERALRMAEQGARAIVVLGVDFMSENVRATLDAAGHGAVPVYRVAQRAIGCSLAESAEALAYRAYLAQAARALRSLHVIYVNTSLRIKAHAERLLPTITCTSSNVLPMLLQAYAQVPDLQVWFGPDTYMGRNLATVFETYARLDDAAARRLHPAHTAATLAAASRRLHHFQQGVCVVHQMFGSAVAERVRRDYRDAFVTAHLEVPGEMFALGFEAQQQGRGVVGSTSNILDFIAAKVEQAVAAGRPAELRFVLGTESGMTTPIARRVRDQLAALRAQGGPEIAVDIVFPVAAEAVAQTPDAELPIVPGVLAGEGCSTEGGCASCPFMKMNSLDALLDVVERIGTDPAALLPFQPRTYAEKIDGQAIADVAGRTIVRMREFQRTGRLPDELAQAIGARA